MKYIKMYNEEFQEWLNGPIVEYIKDCFVDLIDDGCKIEIDSCEKDGKSYDVLNITIKMPKIFTFTYRKKSPYNFEESMYSIDTYTDYYSKLNNIYEEIKTSLDKVSIKYPDLKNVISGTDNNFNIDFFMEVLVNDE